MQVPTAKPPEGDETAEENGENPSSGDPEIATNEPNPGENTTENEQNAEPVLTGFRFVGGGFGHGVGMSQTGAYNLGQQGYSHEQILEFYYPGTVLQPISESITFWDED